MATTDIPGDAAEVVGIDLDNTIIDYDEALHAIALREGMIPEETRADKTAIRDYLRALPDGEGSWRLLQALAYGREIARAQVMPGALDFVKDCRARGMQVHIVSHKSERATADPDGPSLRQSAIRWLDDKGFFGEDTGLSPDRVHFGATRAEKVSIIARLGCTFFIDDLPETFEEPAFPAGTKRLLFRRDAHRGASSGKNPGSWTEFRFPSSDESPSEDASAAVARFLGAAERVRAIKGGRNSRVYRVTAQGRDYALKEYFQPAGDERDRMRTEFGALALMRSAGIVAVPDAVELVAEHHCAFYEWIDGARILSDDATDSDIDEAVSFLAELRGLASSSGHSWRKAASEARYSVADVIGNVEQRLRALDRAPAAADAQSPFSAFLSGRLRPVAASVIARARADAERSGQYDRELPEADRTLSPSDFGFHNALRRPRGGLAFVDFEYFGWDDPAKTISDFVLHPAMSLSVEHKRRFARAALDAMRDVPRLPERLEMVYPLFGLKWVLIILNEFLPEHLARRDFAGLLDGRNDELLDAQLTKAAALLTDIEATTGAFPYA